MKRLLPIAAAAAVAAGISACTVTVAPTERSPGPLDQDRLVTDIKALASDEFGGREPSTPGETLTIEYIKSAFEDAGVGPGNGDSYYQEVPLVAATATDVEPLQITGLEPLAYRESMVVGTKRLVDRIDLKESQIVFVGYGIVAEEYDWDDYAGVDMAGKTALILVNDPGFATRDPARFKGNTMTYYGRWTYKYEEAARQGAAGAIIIHNTAAAGYPWEVVVNSWTGAQYDLVAPDGNLGRAAVEGWVTEETARIALAEEGESLEALMAAAAQPGFEPVPLNARASVAFNNELRESRSKNVVGKIPGATYPDETVIYMAHWDHMGTNPSLEGDDKIFNGAKDNATGTAALIEIARSLGAAQPPQRTLLFLAVTAEESGLLGSAYYGANPLYELGLTVAGFNMDGLNVHGRTKDVVVIGYGSSDLEDRLAEEVALQNRRVDPEPSPEKGFFFRSDHFSLAKYGVPMLYVKDGIDYLDGGESFGRQKAWEWTALRYHKVADEFDPDWDLSGAIEDLELIKRMGWRLANSREFPEWYEGSEFRAAREKTAFMRQP